MHDSLSCNSIFLRILQHVLKSCCSAAPGWWLTIDYIFLVISFVAVLYSTKSSTYNFVKIGLWLSWFGLLAFILNISYGFIDVSDNVKFIPAFSLIGFHLYNTRFCNVMIKSVASVR